MAISAYLYKSAHDISVEEFYGRKMLRSLRLILEFLAGFFGLLAVFGCIAFWRLNDAPISSAFMTPYLESGIEHMLPEAHAQIEHSLLRWDNVDHALDLHADGIELQDDKKKLIAEIPSLDIRLSLFGILLGQLLPTELIIGHPQIRLEHRADGKLYFGGLATGANGRGDLKSTLQTLAGHLPHTHFLRHVAIKRAVIDIADSAGQTIWSVSVPEIVVTHTSHELTGHVIMSLTQKENTATFETHYLFDGDKNLHRLTARFDNITPANLAGGHPEAIGLSAATLFDLPLAGEIEAAFDEELNLAGGSIKVQGEQGTLHMPTLWDQPRSIKAFDLDADFDRTTNHMDVTTLSLDFGGPTASVTLHGTTSTNPKRDLDFTLDAHLQHWPLDQYSQLWPKFAIPSAAAWIGLHLSKGAFDDGKASFKGSLSWKDPSDIDMIDGHGKIIATHATVSYLDGMPSVEDVRADADFDLDKMSVFISGGGIGNLRLNPSTIVFSDFQKSLQKIDIPLKLSGPVTEILHLIDNPPLRYAQAIGLPTDAITGQADVTADMRFPLLNDIAIRDMDVKVSANLTNIASTQLLKGMPMTQGVLALDVNKKSFTVKGMINLNAIPFQITWDQFFDPAIGQPMRRATGKAILKDDQLKAWGIEALNGTRGLTNLTLQLTQNTALKTLLSGEADMTASDVHFDQMNWRKVSGVPALLTFAAEIPKEGDITVKSIQLRGPQADVKGNATVGQDGELKSVALDPFVLGRTDSSLFFSHDEDNNGLRFEAYGKTLDISGLRGGKDPAHTAPRPKEYRVKVDKLFTSTNGMIVKAEGFAIRDAEGWDAIELHGLADGDQALTIDLQKLDSQHELKITCADFGKALKGLGFTDSVNGGKLDISGHSSLDAPRAIEGVVKIGHFDVHSLPALVVLLNATSPFGFMGILTSSTSFDKMNGRFRWQGDALELKQIEAAGTSVGMNVQGKIDMDTGIGKLSGALVPFSTANSLLGSIPVLGDILTGGNGGGVLAVAYNIDGSLSDPKVSVNPVSLLTPGFLRTLFFGNGDEDETDAPVDQTATEKTAPLSKSNIAH